MGYNEPRTFEEVDFERVDTGFGYSAIVARITATAPEEYALFVAGEKTTRVRFLGVGVNSNQVQLWEIYLSPTVSANGTSVVPINRNGKFNPVVSFPSNAPQSALYDTPTVVDPGQLVNRLFISGERTEGVGLTFKLSPNAKILARRVAGVGASVDSFVRLDWSEGR